MVSWQTNKCIVQWCLKHFQIKVIPRSSFSTLLHLTVFIEKVVKWYLNSMLQDLTIILVVKSISYLSLFQNYEGRQQENIPV